jgi:hypothetical protein
MGDAHPGITVLFEVSSFALLVTTLLRFGGLLPAIGCIFVSDLLGSVPIADSSAWYASTTVFVSIAILALTAHAFRTAVAGRPLFKAGFLEPS